MSRVARGILVSLDTATKHAAVAIGDGAAAPLVARSWESGYRHGQEVLAALDGALHDAGVGLRDVEGFVVGTGPGAFTGLRVGLATAKGLAHALGRPIVGIPTTAALAAAAWREPGMGSYGELTIVMPAGPHDRYLARYRLIAAAPATGVKDARAAVGDRDGAAPSSATIEPVGGPWLQPAREPLAAALAASFPVAVDLAAAPGLPEQSIEVGRNAQEGLGRALLALGRRALDAGLADDVAELVPAYVTLPRGIAEQAGEVSWSRDLR